MRDAAGWCGKDKCNAMRCGGVKYRCRGLAKCVMLDIDEDDNSGDGGGEQDIKSG